ncbi:MAG: hypothetical protein AB8B56_08320 [Crocinitomicaceae bacterium]
MTEVLEQQEEDRRPPMLLVLSILSLISIGLSLILTLFQFASGPLDEDEIMKQRVDMATLKSDLRKAGMTQFVAFYDKIQAMSEETNDKFYLSSVVTLLTYLIGLFGVIFMLRRRKLGFHMYIVYCLLAIGGMLLYVSPENIPIMVPIVSLILSGLFIFLYSRTLHWMK